MRIDFYNKALRLSEVLIIIFRFTMFTYGTYIGGENKLQRGSYTTL